ncbi:MAG TPA: NADH-quinone oxidoreductase subunit N [Thermoanaerobaculia bacterium]|nr:NADH-quinone oxidoreductase subunit N [Thermoanaerobaculia bacterium]
MNWTDAVFILPEIIVTIGASLLLIAPVAGFRGEQRTAKWSMLALLVIAAASLVACSWTVPGLAQSSGFAGMFALDAFSIFFKFLFILTIAIITLLSDEFLSQSRYSAWEYYSLLAFALCGMMFMASGVHLASIYVGLELMSLSSYILAGYYKNQLKSTEAAMKYFILGAVSSAILLYGISLIYGVTGTLNLLRIATALSTLVNNDALMFGVMLLGAGLCFKIAAAPFHVWVPDVYEGAPTPITAFLSTASKSAAFAIFARIFYVALPHFQIDWSYVLATIAALSMIVGNVAAITQDNIKRLLAYSSIGHAGYVLLGVISLTEMGVRGILVYSVVYVFATLGIWATVLVLERHEYAGEKISDFEGLHRRAPLWALAMFVFLLSLGGIPPTAGFIGKYFLFYAAVQSGFGWLAVIAVLMSAVSMYYYLRIVVAMYLRDGDDEVAVSTSGSMKLVLAVCIVVTLGIGLAPEWLIQQITSSSQWVVTRASVIPNGR